MASKLLAVTTSIFLATIWLGLASSQVYGQDEEQLIDSYCEGEDDDELASLESMLSDDELDDLDRFCDKLLDFYLEAELDDYDEDKWDDLQDLDTLHAIIMDEFQDAGDDRSEQAISFEELEREMIEAGTTLSDVVWEALLLADELASLQPTTTWGSRFLNFIFPAAVAQDRNRYTTYRTAKQQVKTTVKTYVAKAR